MGFEILRIAKLKNMGDVVRSGKHTFREQPTPNADPEKPRPQVVDGLVRDSDSLVRNIHSRLGGVDKRDKQAVPCVEYLITASKETMKGIDPDAYLDDALKWLKAKHGEQNVVCAVIHRDEDAPHLVAYVVPVVQVEEKIRKRSVNLKGAGSGIGRQIIEQTVPAHTLLSAKAYFGGKDKLAALQTEFHEAVGVKHGLERGVSKVSREHKKTSAWYAEQHAILDKRLEEIEALRANLEVLRVGFDRDQAALDQDGQKVAGESSRLDALRLDLEQREAAAVKDYERLARVKAGLDQREEVVTEKEVAVSGREAVVKDQSAAVVRDRAKLDDDQAHHVSEIMRGKAWLNTVKSYVEAVEVKYGGFTAEQLDDVVKQAQQQGIKPAVSLKPSAPTHGRSR